uniref:Uncharacterized protein n=1 Tax=Pipistrellus kuhlii TaxID=59472 RepID=A0A7J7VV54_PIPKU|nr:hypothetical protein mPipKuh1_008282 [Pipistrellus kuhlii]
MILANILRLHHLRNSWPLRSPRSSGSSGEKRKSREVHLLRSLQASPGSGTKHYLGQWLQLSLLPTPNLKGGWEVSTSCEPQERRERVLSEPLAVSTLRVFPPNNASPREGFPQSSARLHRFLPTHSPFLIA